MREHIPDTFDLGTDGLVTDEPAVTSWMQGYASHGPVE